MVKDARDKSETANDERENAIFFGCVWTNSQSSNPGFMHNHFLYCDIKI